MIPKISRGGRLAGVMVYLVGPGKRNEHTNPHVVAGHDVLEEWSDRALGRDDALDIANSLDLPRKVHGTSITVPVKEWDEEKQDHVVVGRKDAHVWHCSLSLRAEEGVQNDEKWGAIARDFVAGMGFATGSSEDDGCRWVAVRHGLSAAGNDHIHIVVNLVREDGTKARVHDDRTNAQKLARELERKHGLQVLESRVSGRGSQAGASQAEISRVARGQDSVTSRDELRRRLRAAAAGATGEREFLDQLRSARVLVRPHYAKGKAGVRGFSLALVPTVHNGTRPAPVWFSATLLDSTLTLGKLRKLWGVHPDGDPRLTSEWTKRWKRADVADQISASKPPVVSAQALAGLSGKASDGTLRVAAQDAAGIFAGASLALEKGTPGPLARAADAMARAAQSTKWDGEKEREQRRAKEREAVEAAYSARLMVRGTGRSSITGWIAVLRQAQRTMKAVARLQEAQGRVRAAEGTRTALTDVETAIPQLKTPATPSPSAGPGEVPVQQPPGVRRETGRAQDRDSGPER